MNFNLRCTCKPLWWFRRNPRGFSKTMEGTEQGGRWVSCSEKKCSELPVSSSRGHMIASKAWRAGSDDLLSFVHAFEGLDRKRNPFVS